MKIEIWSDFMCPFCYIGKRRFETALSRFSHQEKIEVEWKSFQLMPDLQTDPSKSLNQMLSDSKGISLEQAKEMNEYVVEMARGVGLEYHLDRCIPANTFKAHRLLHFAKQHGVQKAAKEALFRAYFTEGINIDDDQALLNLAQQLGLDRAQVQTMLDEGQFSEQVIRDQYEAQQVGVRGVPFFVFDGQSAVSGAQSSEVFLQALETSFQNWKEESN